MAKPDIHAQSSAKKFGGKPEDYISIHEFLDQSKAYMPDVRHRALTHNSFFVEVIIPKIFGKTITNSDGKQVFTQEIAELHVLEDYKKKFIPTPQDWLENINLKEWMVNGNGELPNSNKLINENVKNRFKENNLQID
jgi:hypothetical protein